MLKCAFFSLYNKKKLLNLNNGVVKSEQQRKFCPILKDFCKGEGCVAYKQKETSYCYGIAYDSGEVTIYLYDEEKHPVLVKQPKIVKVGRWPFKHDETIMEDKWIGHDEFRVVSILTKTIFICTQVSGFKEVKTKVRKIPPKWMSHDGYSQFRKISKRNQQ